MNGKDVVENAIQQQIQTIRSICGQDLVSFDRARELLEAASGSVERALEIHFHNSATASVVGHHQDRDAVAVARRGGVKDHEDPPVNDASSSSRGNRAGQRPHTTTTNTNATSPQRHVPKRQQHQGTLDRFLGLPTPPPKKAKKDPQTKIDAFFKPKQMPPPSPPIPNNTNNMNAAAAETRDPLQPQNDHNVLVGDNDAEDDDDDEEIQVISESVSHATPILNVVESHTSSDDQNGPASSLPKSSAQQHPQEMHNDVDPSVSQQDKPTNPSVPPSPLPVDTTQDGTKEMQKEGEKEEEEEEEDLTVQSPATLSTASSSSTQPDLMTMKTRDVPYQWLSHTFAIMADTTKRNVKLSALVGVLSRILTHLGGISPSSTGANSSHDTRDDAVYVLTCTLDLILGKISIVKDASSSTTTNTTKGSSRSTSTTTSTTTHLMSATPLQVSGSAVSTAVQTVTGASRQQLRQAYRTSGDLGDCAAKYYQPRSSVKRFFVPSNQSTTNHSILTVVRVHETLQKIATVAIGQGSQKMRQDLMVGLLRACHDNGEVRFLVRTLLGNMRLGATIKSIVAALAQTFEEAGRNTLTGYTPMKDPTKALQKVFYLCPRLDRIVAALLTGGIPYAVQHCSVEVGYPIQPMLANPAHSLDEVQQFMASSSAADTSEWQAVAEWKYDGVRCQAHWDGSSVKLFSRNLIENTLQYPDAVEYLRRAMKPIVTSFILDSELVGVTPCTQARDGYRLLPFQDLSTRRGIAKQDKDVTANTSDRVQIRIYAFDLLYLNGESLLQQPLWLRQELLQQHFDVTDGLGFATSVAIPRYDKTLIEETLQESVRDGAEGLMIKLTGRRTTVDESCGSDHPATREFGYESGTRSQLWLKLKRDYVDGGFGGATTIDVVPIGSWYGTGRKATQGFLSPVLFAVYDDDEGVYYSISRCMTFSDDMYTAMREFYFHGTPYPDGVGIGEEVNTTASGADEGDASHDSDNELDGKMVEDSTRLGDDGVAEPEDADVSDGVQNRVNCLDGRPPWIVTNESPPIWFQPSEVFEISFADLSLSTSHTAASHLIGQNGRGIALRFPRFKRRRPDKSIEQATTPAEIARLFFQQSKVKGSL